MTDIMNVGPQVTPTVVPARFVPPAPEQFEKPVTQNQRTQQSKQGQGFILYHISFLENQLHLAQYKRVNVDQTDAELVVLIKNAKTAGTIMRENIQAWAGSLTKEELEAALPTIWAHYVQLVEAEDSPAPEPVLVNLDELEPIQIINRPAVSEDAPKSALEVPEQLNLGEMLGKISEDNNSE